MNNAAAVTSFPVFQSFREGCSSLWQGQRALLNLLALSSAIIGVFLLMLPFFFDNHDVFKKAAGYAVDFYTLTIGFLVGPAAILAGVENRALSFNITGNVYWRYVKAVLLVMVLFMLLIFVTALIVFALNTALSKAVAIVVGTSAVAALVYASLRLWFIMPLAVSTEMPILQTLKAAWAIGCGRFWRTLGLIVLSIIVATIINFVGALVFGLGFGAYYASAGILHIVMAVAALLGSVVGFHLLAVGSAVVSAVIGAAYRHIRSA